MSTSGDGFIIRLLLHVDEHVVFGVTLCIRLHVVIPIIRLAIIGLKLVPTEIIL